jgi:hypothetical protein
VLKGLCNVSSWIAFIWMKKPIYLSCILYSRPRRYLPNFSLIFFPSTRQYVHARATSYLQVVGSTCVVKLPS